MSRHILYLRLIHGLFAAYFTFCLTYLYYVGFTGVVHDLLFVLATVSLAVEGILVFALNGGDCPLIHIQRRIGDDKPFFELILPRRMAKQAIPLFTAFTFIALLIIMMRFVVGSGS